MFCSINKWMISRALDTGKPLPGRVKNHLQRCDTCREFASFCTSLKPKLMQDKNAMLERFDEALTKKILSNIPEDLKAASAPEHRTSIRKMVARRPALIPSLSAALVVLGILISLLFLTHPRSQDMDPLGQLTAFIRTASPEDVLSKMESPLETEYRELKQTLDSTTRSLLSSLEFRLGQQAK
jgi:hypothetical protein